MVPSDIHSDDSNGEIMTDPSSSEESERGQPYAHKILWAGISCNHVLVVDAKEKDGFPQEFSAAITKTAEDLRQSPSSRADFDTCEYKPPKAFLGVRRPRKSTVPPLMGKKYTLHEYDGGINRQKQHEHESKEAEEEDDYDDVNQPISTNPFDDTPRRRRHRDTNPHKTVWTFYCVYNPTATAWSPRPYPHLDRDIEAFLKELNRISVPFRESPSSPWRMTSPDNWANTTVQDQFAHVLLGAMRDVSYIGKRNRIQQSVATAQEELNDNITRMLDRNQVQAANIVHMAQDLESATKVFQKKSKTLKKDRQWKDRKMALIVGGSVATCSIAVVLPLLIALL